MPLPRPTLRSLAKEARVSAMTVSLALRNSREVSAGTRARIKRLAAARGYRRDPTLTKLMHHLRTRAPRRMQASVCALGHQWPARPADPAGFYARLRGGLSRRADSLGFAFTEISVDEYREKGSLQRVLVHRGVEGLVILPLLHPSPLDRLLDWSLFSTVAVTSSVLSPQFHSVVPQHFDNMLRVCDALTRSGFKRIGLAISWEHDVRTNHRWLGAMTWHNSRASRNAVIPLLGQKSGPWLEASELLAWLRRERPDAVVMDPMDGPLISQVWAQLPRRQRPRVVTMNWPDPAADAGIDQRVEEVGAVAIETLAGMITRGDKGVPFRANATLVAGDWAVGPSLLQRPARG